MPTFHGINHLTLTVTDIDVSERFYTEVLDFLAVIDGGDNRVCLHPATGFILGLRQHPSGTGAPFSELHTGLDHVGLAVEDRDELVAWERRLAAAGATYTPIRDLELGHHLNFRDPDGIALELYAPNAVMAAALHAVRSGRMSHDDIAAFVEEHVGAAFVSRRRAAPTRP